MLTKNKLFFVSILVLLYRIRSFFHLILLSYFIDFVSFRYIFFSYFTDFVVSFGWISFSYFTDFASFRWISFSYFTDFVSFRWIWFSYFTDFGGFCFRFVSFRFSVYRYPWEKCLTKHVISYLSNLLKVKKSDNGWNKITTCSLSKRMNLTGVSTVMGFGHARLRTVTSSGPHTTLH